jgi:hypothetical protein
MQNDRHGARWLRIRAASQQTTGESCAAEKFSSMDECIVAHSTRLAESILSLSYGSATVGAFELFAAEPPSHRQELVPRAPASGFGYSRVREMKVGATAILRQNG